MFVQRAVRVVGGEIQIAASAFRIEAGRHGKRFDQSRLPRSVVADQGGHLREFDLGQPPYRSQVEGIAGGGSRATEARSSQEGHASSRVVESARPARFRGTVRF